MILNKEGRKEIREYMEKELGKVETDIPIKFDKELIESLLFETIDGVKYPAWTGDFLRKIDLSEICFNGVCFDAERIKSLYKAYGINYLMTFVFSYTNAKIDFTKISGQNISYCCFKGMNLLDSNISTIVEMSYCDFTDSKIKFTYGSETFKPVLEKCNFTNCDMSKCCFDYNTLKNNIFQNTNLKVTMDEEDREEMRKIGIMIKNGVLDGCYVNGTYILPKDRRKVHSRNKNSEYCIFKEDIKRKIRNQINDQVSEQRQKQKKKD